MTSPPDHWLVPMALRPALAPRRDSSAASDDTIEIPRSFSPPAASYAWNAGDQGYVPAFSLDGHRVSDPPCEVPLIHYCAQCGAWRSEAFHVEHPLLAGMGPITSACDECVLALELKRTEPQPASRPRSIPRASSPAPTVRREIEEVTIHRRRASREPMPISSRKEQSNSTPPRMVHVYALPPKQRPVQQAAAATAKPKAQSASPPRYRRSSLPRAPRPKYVIERYIVERSASPAAKINSPPSKPKEVVYRHVEIVRPDPNSRNPREKSRSMSPRPRPASRLHDQEWYYAPKYDVPKSLERRPVRPKRPSQSPSKIASEEPEWYFEKTIRRVTRDEGSARNRQADIVPEVRYVAHRPVQKTRDRLEELPGILKRTVSAPLNKNGNEAFDAQSKATAYPSMSGALPVDRDISTRGRIYEDSSYAELHDQGSRLARSPVATRIVSDFDKPKDMRDRLRRQDPSPPSPEPRARSYHYENGDVQGSARPATPSTVSSQKRVQFAADPRNGAARLDREEVKERSEARHDQRRFEHAKKKVREGIHEGGGAFEVMH